MFDPQPHFDRAFEEFSSGKITRPQYVEAVDRVFASLPLARRANLDRRRDGRSAGLFALHVHDCSARERFLVDAWTSLFPDRDLEVLDNGISNDGRLVFSPGRGGSRADYILKTERGGRPLELKFGPCQGFVTYKVADLENYISQGDVLVLTILGDCRMVGPNGDPACDRPLGVPRGLKWSLMDDSSMRTFLAEAEHGRHRGFGGKETARLHSRDFPGVFKLRDWRPVGRRVACPS